MTCRGGCRLASEFFDLPGGGLGLRPITLDHRGVCGHCRNAHTHSQLKPTGDGHRDRLVAARINLRRSE